MKSPTLLSIPMVIPKFREAFLPVVYFGLLYWSITQYSQPISEYRDVLATAALAVACSLLALRWTRGEEIRPLSPRVALFWLAFFVLGFLSASFAVRTNNAFGQLRLYFCVFLLGFGFRTWLGEPSQRVIVGLLFVLCLVHVLILTVVLGYASGLVADSSDLGATVPYHSNIRHVAHHGMLSACAGLALFLIGGRLRYTGYLLATASTFGLFFLGQRGGLLGLGLFIALAAFFLPKIRKRIITTGLSVILVSVALTYALDKNGIANRYSGSIVERIRMGGSEAFTSTSGRLAVWESSIELALERPLLGHGPDGFRTSEIGKSFPGIIQSHNLFLQVFVEFGAAGLVLVFAFLYQLLRQPLKRMMEDRKSGGSDSAYALLFGILLSFLAVSLLEGLFYHAVSLLTISVLAPMVFSASADTKG